MTGNWNEIMNVTCTPKSDQFQTSVNRTTVEPRYVELGYLKQNMISLGFFLSHLLWAISNSVIANTPLYLELFLAPLSSNQPWLSRTLLRSEETLVKISQKVQSRHLPTRCTDSWEMYWRVYVINESKVRLTGLTAECRRRQVAGIWGSNYCSKSPAISNNFSIPLRVRDSGVRLYDIIQHEELGFQELKRCENVFSESSVRTSRLQTANDVFL